MKEKYRNKRFDDVEMRSKMELLAELQVHQTELETQNHELKKMQQQLEESLERYTSLYDYAPVGYLTLDKKGIVLEINLTGCVLLGFERTHILKKPFTLHLVKNQYQTFLHFLHQTFNSNDNVVTELSVKHCLHQELYIRLESRTVNKTNTCRVIMTDINELKKTTNLNNLLFVENRGLVQRLFAIQEKERRYVVRELHDELGQWISAIYAEAEAISNHANQESTIYASAQSISECTHNMHHVIRRMLFELRPPLLDTFGLKDALLELKEQWRLNHPGISLEYKLEGELDKLDEVTNITVYRIIQESLNNVISHAEATRVQLFLSRETDADSAVDTLTLRVKDNGKGYDKHQASGGIGMLGMRERAVAINGNFAVRSSPDDGTEIYVTLPVKKN
jgi:PAS domain S-box-containing protein